MGLKYSPTFYVLRDRALRFDRLRTDAAAQGFTEASIAYGWTAIRLMQEALAIQAMDLNFVKHREV